VLCCVVLWCEQEMSLARNWVMEEDGRWRRLIIEGEEEETKKATTWVIKDQTNIIIVPNDIVKKSLGYRMVRSVHCLACPLSAVRLPSAVCCPPAVHLPSAVCCLLSTVRLPPAVCCCPPAVHCPACPLSRVSAV
jgi:hypothetical protein